MSSNTSSPAPAPSRFGRNQWIVVGTFLLAFLSATGGFFGGKIGSSAYLEFLETLVQSSLAISLGGSVLAKGVRAVADHKTQKPNVTHT